MLVLHGEGMCWFNATTSRMGGRVHGYVTVADRCVYGWCQESLYVEGWRWVFTPA